MTQTILTPDVVAREALLILKANTVTASLVYRDFEQEWTGMKKGDTVRIRQPASFAVEEFTTSIVVQDIDEGSVPLQVEKHFDVSVAVTSKEWTLELDAFATRVIAPAMNAIAQGIDEYILSKYIQIGNTGGDPTKAVMKTLADMADARKVLNITKAPLPDRNGIINPATEAGLLTLDAIVHADKSGSTEALREASLGRVMGANWWMDQNVPDHIPGDGTASASPVVAGANAIGVTSIGLTLAGVEELNAGDVFTITGDITPYAVQADAVAVAGAITVEIYPALKVATVGSEVIVFKTASTGQAAIACNLYFHRNAIALAVVPLELPRGNANAQIVNYEGFGIRVVYGYDTTSKKDTISFDVLCGAKVIQPELAMRQVGSLT